MKITWFGTASILLSSKDKSVLFDPFIGLRGCENKTYAFKFFKEKYIFISHGHFDHLSDVKNIIENGSATVYCTETPSKILKSRNVNPDRISVIHPHDVFHFDGIKIKVIKSKHNKVDVLLRLRHWFSPVNIFRNIKYARNFFSMLFGKKDFIKGGETSAFIAEAENKRILILGSMGIDEDEKEELKDIDILVLPYQGRYNNLPAAKKIINIIRPQTVILSHFDDSFPPITDTINTKPFFKAMKNEFPEISVIKPEFGKAIDFNEF